MPIQNSPLRIQKECGFGLGYVEQAPHRINQASEQIEWCCIEYCPFPMCQYHQNPEYEGIRRHYFGRAGIM